MYYELIAIFILIISLLGMAVILWRKITVLAELLEVPLEEEKQDHVALKVAQRIKSLPPFKKFSSDIFLQRTLSRIRILILKIDNKIFSWIQELRENVKKEKFSGDDSYWKEIKKIAGKK